MTLVIRPEPSDQERAAIVLALEVLDGPGRDSEWWRRGIEDALGADGQEEGA